LFPSVHKMRHQCADCSKVYRQRSSLLRHRASAHLGVKKECHCGRAFTQTAALQRHQRAAHGSSRLECQCGRLFTSNDSLKKHVHTHHWTPDQRCRAKLGGWCTMCWRVQLGFHGLHAKTNSQCAECSGVVSTQRYFLRFVAQELGDQWLPSSLDNVVLGGCDGVRRRRPDVGFLFHNADGQLRFVDLEVDEDGHPRRDPTDEWLKIQDTARALPNVDVLTIRVDVPSHASSSVCEPLARRAAQAVRSAIAHRGPDYPQVEFLA
jgi:hypothetical protein